MAYAQTERKDTTYINSPNSSDSALSSTKAIEENNKEIARNFFEDLWFSKNTDNYKKYFAAEYVIRDLDDQQDVTLTETAITQKEIADFFWANGEMSGVIDYQIADGDKVATRWYWTYKPTSLLGNFIVGDVTIPVINVFHFKDGKIIEINNHRHDISLNRTNIFLLKGLGYGLLTALIPTFFVFRYRRKNKRLLKNA